MKDRILSRRNGPFPDRIPVPPQSRVRTAVPFESISIPFPLDLDDLNDLKILNNAVKDNAEYRFLLNDTLPFYLSFFLAEHWRIVEAQGAILIPEGPKAQYALSLVSFLRTVRKLQTLSQYKRFSYLIEGFNNPTRVDATIFEINIAHWCHERAYTLDIQFSPPVKARGKSKLPEFLWRTMYGDLFVECKSLGVENKYSDRLHRLFSIAKKTYDSHGSWRKDLRVHVYIAAPAKNRVGERIRICIENAYALQLQSAGGEQIQDGEVIVTLNLKGPFAFPEPGSIACGAGTAIDKEQDLTFMDLTMSLQLSEHRTRAAGGMIRNARTQMPDSGYGAAFISLKPTPDVVRKVHELLNQHEYRRTPFVAICGDGKIQAVWKLKQPFDGKLLISKEEFKLEYPLRYIWHRIFKYAFKRWLGSNDSTI